MLMTMKLIKSFLIVLFFSSISYLFLYTLRLFGRSLMDDVLNRLLFLFNVVLLIIGIFLPSVSALFFKLKLMSLRTFKFTCIPSILFLALALGFFMYIYVARTALSLCDEYSPKMHERIVADLFDYHDQWNVYPNSLLKLKNYTIREKAILALVKYSSDDEYKSVFLRTGNIGCQLPHYDSNEVNRNTSPQKKCFIVPAGYYY